MEKKLKIFCIVVRTDFDFFFPRSPAPANFRNIFSLHPYPREIYHLVTGIILYCSPCILSIHHVFVDLQLLLGVSWLPCPLILCHVSVSPLNFSTCFSSLIQRCDGERDNHSLPPLSCSLDMGQTPLEGRPKRSYFIEYPCM